VDGWRDRRANCGIVIQVATQEIICEGLSMPHSPRMHQGELWILNSGTGELEYVDPINGVGYRSLIFRLDDVWGGSVLMARSVSFMCEYHFGCCMSHVIGIFLIRDTKLHQS
jgi:hypothetical protein